MIGKHMKIKLLIVMAFFVHSISMADVINASQDQLEQVLKIDPNNSSNHLLLAQTFDKGGYKVPALLAVCRFLILEPQSESAKTELKFVHEMLQSGSDENLAPEKMENLDFNALYLSLSMCAMTCKQGENANKSPMQQMACQLNAFFDLFSITHFQNPSDFTCTYYIPYFIQLQQKHYADVFCYYIHQSENTPEIKKWLENNRKRVNEFLEWSRNYKWVKKS